MRETGTKAPSTCCRTAKTTDKSLKVGDVHALQ